MAWRARTDSNHAAIRQALRAHGWLVADVSRLKKHWDLTCFHPARGTYLFVDAKAAKGKLTDSQEQLVSDGWPIRFVRSVDEVGQL